MGNPQRARKILSSRKRIYVGKKKPSKAKLWVKYTHAQNNMMYSTFMGEFSITMLSLYLN